jgi:hypothetical protein
MDSRLTESFGYISLIFRYRGLTVLRHQLILDQVVSALNIFITAIAPPESSPGRNGWGELE